MHVSGVGAHTLSLSTSVNPAATYTIQGQVTVNGNPLPFALVSAGDLAVLTALDGSYSISGLFAGTYTLTVSKQEYTFNSQNPITVGPSKSGINFVGVQNTYSITGRVTDVNGNGLSNASVSTGSASVQTAANGSYTLNGLVAGAYTLTANATGYTFNNQQTVNIGPPQNGINFTGAAIPIPLSVNSITLSPNSYQGWAWGYVMATVTLAGTLPPGGTTVTISSSNPAVCPVGNIWMSGSTATFAIPVLDVSTTTIVTITASVNGSSKSVDLTVLP
jgi:hypothetical protein